MAINDSNFRLIQVGGGSGGSGTWSVNVLLNGDRVYTDSISGTTFTIPKPILDVIGDINTNIEVGSGLGVDGGDIINFNVDGINVGSVEVIGGVTKWTLNGILDPIVYAGTPRTIAQRNALTSVKGYLVYISDGVIEEYQYYNGVTWISLGATSTTTIIDDLTTGGATEALSAEQGKVLENKKVNKPIASTQGFVATVDATGNDVEYIVAAPTALPSTQLEVTDGTAVANKYVQPDTLKVELDKKLDDTQLIDDDTFATATSTNIPSAESTKVYVDSKIDDTAYNSVTWDTVVDKAPSQNAVRDIIEKLLSDSSTNDSDSGENIVTIDGFTYGGITQNAVKVNVLTAAPIDGTTVAYYVGQLFWDRTNKKLYEVTAKSTDPDLDGTGSTFLEVSFETSFEEVTDFAELALLPATTGDLKMVTNEDGRQYLLRYNSIATFGLVPSSDTVQPGVEIIGYNVVPNTVETASVHGLVVNDAFVIRSASDTVLAFDPDLIYGQTYYIETVPTATTFTLSDTLGGAAKVFTTTMSSPQNSNNFVYTSGWWNVVSGGSQLPNEKYLTPRIIDQNNKYVEVNNAVNTVYWDTDRTTHDNATIINSGGINVSSVTQDSYSSVNFDGFVSQNNTENSRIRVNSVNSNTTLPWITGDISAVEKLGIYTYEGNPNTFITANKGAVCFDTTSGLVYRKTTDAANTGWTTGENFKTVTADYTVLDTDQIISIDATAGDVTVTFPLTLIEGQKFTIQYKQDATNTITLVAGAGSTIVNPSTYLDTTSFVVAGTVGQFGTSQIFRVGTVFNFIG